MPQDSLTITDNRTGRTYEVPVSEGTVRATDLRQIKVADDDFGLMTYDPAFMNTAACRSAITYIDGDRGILRYRGYPIESWPSGRPSSRWRTCSSRASSPPGSSSTAGPTR